jgi:hypothetical protein
MTHLHKVPQRIESQSLHYALKRSILRFMKVFALTHADNEDIADSLVRLGELTSLDDISIELTEISASMDRVRHNVITSEKDENTLFDRLSDIDDCVADFTTSVPLKLGLKCVSGCDSALIMKRLEEYASTHQTQEDFQALMVEINQALQKNHLSGQSLCNISDDSPPHNLRKGKRLSSDCMDEGPFDVSDIYEDFD